MTIENLPIEDQQFGRMLATLLSDPDVLDRGYFGDETVVFVVEDKDSNLYRSIVEQGWPVIDGYALATLHRDEAIAWVRNGGDDSVKVQYAPGHLSVLVFGRHGVVHSMLFGPKHAPLPS